MKHDYIPPRRLFIAINRAVDPDSFEPGTIVTYVDADHGRLVIANRYAWALVYDTFAAVYVRRSSRARYAYLDRMVIVHDLPNPPDLLRLSDLGAFVYFAAYVRVAQLADALDDER